MKEPVSKRKLKINVKNYIFAILRQPHLK